MWAADALLVYQTTTKVLFFESSSQVLFCYCVLLYYLTSIAWSLVLQGDQILLGRWGVSTRKKILKAMLQKSWPCSKWLSNSKIVWECEAPVFKKLAARYHLHTNPHHRYACPHKSGDLEKWTSVSTPHYKRIQNARYKRSMKWMRIIYQHAIS